MVYGVILAAGIGSRMKSKTKKQFMLLKNKPVFYYSVEKFLKIKNIDKIILVINDKDKDSKIIKDFIKKYKCKIYNEIIYLITGGKERYDSVYNAITFIKSIYEISNNDKIIIHDSARPNVDINDIKKLISYIDKYKVVTLSYKLTDTIKKTKHKNEYLNEVIKTLDRDEYSLITTPQGFNLKTLNSAYEKFIKNMKKIKITDDLQIIENFSKVRTYTLNCNKNNIKITTKEDLDVLKCIIKGL